MKTVMNAKSSTRAVRAASSAAVAGPKASKIVGGTVATMLATLPAQAGELMTSVTTELPQLPSITAQLPSELTSDPLLLGGAGAAVTLLMLGAAAAATSGPSAKSTPAKQAFQVLESDERSVLLDIRPKSVVKEEGSPEVKVAKKRSLALPYTTVDGEEVAVAAGFAEAAAKLPALSPEALVILVDEAGEQGAAAGAALLAYKEFAPKKVYFVSGGAAAWRAAELPWREPVKLPELPALSLPSLGAAPVSLDALAAAYKANPSAATAAGAALAAVATATFAIREFELLAQLAGLFAVGQFAVRNLLWADQREKTLASISSFMKNTGTDEAAEDLKKLASTILESATAEIAVQTLTEEAKTEAAAGGEQSAAPEQALSAVEANAANN